MTQMICDVNVITEQNKDKEDKNMLHMMTKGMEKKVNFVKELSEAIIKVQENVTGIEYRIYQNIEPGHEDWAEEYLIINYRGGARTVRNCYGNSCYAILEEISKYLEHGYYNEEKDLTNIERDPAHWKLISVNTPSLA